MILTPTQITQIETQLRQHLDEPRYLHVHSVREFAETLAKRYHADVEKARVAALLHDYVKWQSPEALAQTAQRLRRPLDPYDLQFPKILHAIVGAEVARQEFGIQDEAILAAIRQHTTGDAGMGLLAKILYVADYAEPLRTHELAAVVREKALHGDLDEACLIAVDGTIRHLLAKRALIHPRTLAAHNDLVLALRG